MRAIILPMLLLLPKPVYVPKFPEIKQGYYECSGTLSSGKHYQSLVTIRQVDEAYIIRWIDDDSIIIGIGMRDRDRLCIGYSLVVDGKKIQGVSIMKTTPDGLSGLWMTLPGSGETCTETWKYLKSFKEPDNVPEHFDTKSG